MDQSKMDHETWSNQKPARKIFSCHPERSKFLRSRKNVRSRKTPQYRSLPLTASGTNQKSGGQIFSCHLSDASSSLAKKVAESKDPKTAGFPSPP
jgi:hypothetical protein